MRTAAEDNADQRNFQSCAWMTRELQKAAIEQVRDMLSALTMGRSMNVERCERTHPGIPYAPHYEWVVSVGEWFVTGETKEEAECKMLGLILRNGIGWPLFRGCKPNVRAHRTAHVTVVGDLDWVNHSKPAWSGQLVRCTVQPLVGPNPLYQRNPA